MKLKTKLTALVAILGLGLSSGLMGQDTLAQFLAQETDENSATQAPFLFADNITVSPISGTEGGNILIKSPTSAWTSEDHYGYGPGDGAYAGARSDTGYTFTLTADAGFSFNLDQVSFRHRATAAGPGEVGISINGTNFDGSNMSVSTTVNTFTSDALNLTNLTTASFVVQGWGSGGTGNGEFQMNDLQVTGTVIPEPGTYAALIGLAALGFVVYRRRKARQEA